MKRAGMIMSVSTLARDNGAGGAVSRSNFSICPVPKLSILSILESGCCPMISAGGSYCRLNHRALRFGERGESFGKEEPAFPASGGILHQHGKQHWLSSPDRKSPTL